jgi:2-polyprenyl-3-methyl-5-hydroxy-6-metoxy-1,4-benzoquinol methylase
VRNIVDEAPTRELHGRLAFARDFVLESDCTGRDILDVGCGFGWFELLALDRGARSVTGVEPHEADLATARRHLDDERLTFQAASAISLPFDDASFDTVVCWEVLEHIPTATEQRAFCEFARVLRPGGVLYLSTPHATPAAKATDPAWWLIRHRHYQRRQVAEFARTAALEVDQLVTRGGWWEILRMTDLYVSKWLLRRPPLFQRQTTRQIDREWSRPGFTHVFVRCRKSA